MIQKFLRRISDFFMRRMSDDDIEAKYVEAGKEFGNAVSYLYLGECVGFEFLLSRLAKWEKEYSERGYQTISIDAFIGSGGYGKPIENLGKKRTTNEPPVLHAEIYRNEFLGRYTMRPEMENVIKEGTVQTFEFIPPSTIQKNN